MRPLLLALSLSLLPAADFATELPLAGTLGVGPAFDAVVDGRHLYSIAGGALHIADISRPAKPVLIGKLAGLGHVRQLVVRNHIAYVTAREDGFFLIDVKNPRRPTLITHYDTIELATGLAISGNFAYIACRQAGVEIVDIANPRRPRHLSTIRVGEGQSLAASPNGYLFIGVWRARQLVIVDARNPRQPSIVSTTPLDGYGDGVAIRGNIAYVATGHHSTASTEAWPNPDMPGYGQGHGLEIFDVSDLRKPALLSRTKTRVYYGLYMDTWRVRLSGNRAYLNDTYNGVFILDIADPRQPRFLAHRQLPVVPGRGDGDLPVDPKPSPAVGLAVAKDFLYVAGAWSDVHIVPAPGLATPLDPPPPSTLSPLPSNPPPDPRFQTYNPGGQVYAVDLWKSSPDNGPATLLVAAGMAGLRVVQAGEKFTELAHYPTAGFASSVAHRAGIVYVAEGLGGLGIYRETPAGKLEKAGNYRVPNQSVQQVVATPDGRHVLLHVGMNRLHIVNVTNPATPTLALEDLHPGLFYLRAIPPAFAADRFSMVTWTVSGPFLYEVSGIDKPRFTGFQYPFRIGTENGAAPDGPNWLVTTAGKYFLLAPGETRPPKEMTLVSIPGVDLSGKPTLFGDTLFTANALTGQVHAVDVADRARPRLLASALLPEHPGHIVAWNGAALIPAGYQGLLLWNYRDASAASIRASSRISAPPSPR